MKNCKKCSVEKPVNEFYKGRGSCKSCYYATLKRPISSRLELYMIRYCDFTGPLISKIPHPPRNEDHYYEFYSNLEAAKTNAIDFIENQNKELLNRFHKNKTLQGEIRKTQAGGFS